MQIHIYICLSFWLRSTSILNIHFLKLPNSLQTWYFLHTNYSVTPGNLHFSDRI